MWYVKDEFSNKIYFKSNDVSKSQSFVVRYNSTFKFSSQRYFLFTISTFSGFMSSFYKDKIDINAFTLCTSIFSKVKYAHCLSVTGYNEKHLRYVERKFDLICKLCKKYHVWSFTKDGRKCDGFDF